LVGSPNRIRTYDLSVNARDALRAAPARTEASRATGGITAFASLEEARAAKINNAEFFSSAQELVKLAA